ncbi:fatty acid desaturase [Paenarthrobacter nitroguajacolicus]|uniref:fatty acid desaturase family protein n=1 Tax=Paenarthrobacter TaxID=1742992 RepID=UPI0028646997|nr:acyl-CoA desaturase [Paenarthrobacter nitroguajacolicus]MDR6987397.1 fatty acid desaturase [Paenarthrobacter nitroguajacolicus]
MAPERSSDEILPDRGAARTVTTYATLLKSVRNAGLLKRRRGFYITVFVLLMAAWAGTWGGFFVLRDTWFQLLIAAGMGVVLTQFAFFAHEAAHRQVFKSKGMNEWSARLVGTALVGISYSMWAQKHTRHHNFPNVIDKDPDIHTGAIAFHPEAASRRRGAMVHITRKQGWLLFPLLFFLGVSLHVDSLKYLLHQRKVDHRWVEIPVIMLRLMVVPLLVFWLLPLGMAFAFLGVQLGVFGFYMGASFAPNHKGMPILPTSSRADFLNRQVLTARNISGGRFMDVLMGGLNRQIEHHLFPDMPRPHLHRASGIVKACCDELDIPYTETSLGASYVTVVRYLDEVGLFAGEPFECPVVDQFRRR